MIAAARCTRSLFPKKSSCASRPQRRSGSDIYDLLEGRYDTPREVRISIMISKCFESKWRFISLSVSQLSKVSIYSRKQMISSLIPLSMRSTSKSAKHSRAWEEDKRALLLCSESTSQKHLAPGMNFTLPLQKSRNIWVSRESGNFIHTKYPPKG